MVKTVLKVHQVPLCLYLTVESSISMWAGALVCAITVLAGATVHAGFGVALIDVMLAIATSEAWRA